MVFVLVYSKLWDILLVNYFLSNYPFNTYYLIIYCVSRKWLKAIVYDNHLLGYKYLYV